MYPDNYMNPMNNPIIFGSDPNHFSMLCCVPNTVYTPTAPTVPTVEVLED